MDTYLITLSYLTLEELLILYPINVCDQVFAYYHKTFDLESHLRNKEYRSVEYLISLKDQLPNLVLEDRYINIAARRGNLKLVKLLVAQELKFTRQTFGSGIMGGNLELVKYLLDNNVATKTCSIDFIITYGTAEICYYLFQERVYLQNVFLIALCKQNKLDILKYFINQGIQPTVEMLKEATYNGHLNMVKYLYYLVKLDNFYSTLFKDDAEDGWIHQNILEFYKEVKFIK